MFSWQGLKEMFKESPKSMNKRSISVLFVYTMDQCDGFVINTDLSLCGRQWIVTIMSRLAVNFFYDEVGEITASHSIYVGEK